MGAFVQSPRSWEDKALLGELPPEIDLTGDVRPLARRERALPALKRVAMDIFAIPRNDAHVASAARALWAGTLVALLSATSSCDRDRARKGTRPPPSAHPLPPAQYAPDPSASPSSSALPIVTPSASSALPHVVNHAYDAGTNACRIVYGPAQQPFLGEVALAPLPTGVLVITQRDGIPTVTRVEPGDAAAPAASVVDAGLPRVASPPCVVAGAFSFCMDPAGTIHKRSLESEGRDVVVARSAPAASFAAEALPGGLVVVAYLADRQTTEGRVSEAYAALDDGPPLRLSDEGSGTTHVTLARRGGGVIALLLDGRVAMTPVHSRTLSLVAGKLTASDDAVVFVGGGAEANTRGALGVLPSGDAFALVPIAGENGFGLATVHLDDPPRIDEPTTWSLYLNGLDPAPIAATRGVNPIRVARVRPLEARAEAPRGLELGKLDETGAFVSYGLVGSKGRVRSAALAVDGAGFLWVAFTDGSGTWLERRACP